MHKDNLGLGHDLGHLFGGRHAYVPSVGVTMVVEGFPRLIVVDDRDDVHHKGIPALFAMSRWSTMSSWSEFS